MLLNMTMTVDCKNMFWIDVYKLFFYLSNFIKSKEKKSFLTFSGDDLKLHQPESGYRAQLAGRRSADWDELARRPEQLADRAQQADWAGRVQQPQRYNPDF